MGSEFADSPGKRTVREQWNTPLLRYLYKRYNIQYRYMGLPGVDLLDVHLWKDMIREVVAFEVPARPTTEDELGRRYIVKLRENLDLLGITARAYYGPMESVVILREDYEGTEYRQDRFITLYNLDFCGQIAGRIPTRTAGEKISRFEAIRQILADQREAYRQANEPSVFVMLMTVRNEARDNQLHSFLGADVYSDTQVYLDKCGGLVALPSGGAARGTYTWALKAFLHNLIRQYLSNPHISACFFPIVKYTGRTQSSPMLHCMIICRFDSPQTATPLYLPYDYLTSVTSVRARDDQVLVWESEPGESITNGLVPSPERWFKGLENKFLRGF